TPFRCSRSRRSFPTRRSSDLLLDVVVIGFGTTQFGGERSERLRGQNLLDLCLGQSAVLDHLDPAVTLGEGADGLVHRRKVGDARSEEHTSELQSRENLVCRLA